MGSQGKVSWSGHVRDVLQAFSSSGEDEVPITLRGVCEEVNKKQISLNVIGAPFSVDWAGEEWNASLLNCEPLPIPLKSSKIIVLAKESSFKIPALS